MLTSGGHAGDLERCEQLGVAANLIKPVRRDGYSSKPLNPRQLDELLSNLERA
jgi:hypothetical protein